MPGWKTFSNPDRLLAVPRSHCPARTTHGPIQDHFSNRPPLPPKLPDTPHSDSEKKEWRMLEKNITLELNRFLIQNVNSRNTKILSNKTTTRLTRVQQHRVFISGLVPRNRPRLIGWAFYFYKCSPIVLGKNRGGCSWFVHIPPIENIFLVVSKNPF
jgi:hypothetical protein